MAAHRGLPNLTAFVALGKVAHDSLCRSFGLPVARRPNSPMAPSIAARRQRLIDSYHCSRYNQNTRRLDAAMFESVFERALDAMVEEMRTERLLLRRARLDDSVAIHAMMSDPDRDALLVDAAARGPGRNRSAGSRSMVEADPAMSDDFIVTLTAGVIGKFGALDGLPEIRLTCSISPPIGAQGSLPTRGRLAAFLERRRALGSTRAVYAPMSTRAMPPSI